MIKAASCHKNDSHFYAPFCFSPDEVFGCYIVESDFFSSLSIKTTHIWMLVFAVLIRGIWVWGRKKKCIFLRISSSRSRIKSYISWIIHQENSGWKRDSYLSNVNCMNVEERWLQENCKQREREMEKHLCQSSSIIFMAWALKTFFMCFKAISKSFILNV